MLPGRASDQIERATSGATAVLERSATTAGTDPRPRRTRWAQRLVTARADLIVAGAYLTLAAYVLSGQWRSTGTGYLVKSGQDQSMWEWFFAETAHSIAHLQNPLGTRLQNFPAGVNMMANTAMFGVGVPLTPVTMLFGPTVTFVLVLTLGLSGTALAWYWLFSRELVRSRFAAAIGGLFCGFAPAMISHANAHPNFVLLAALPVIAMLLIRMARRVSASEDPAARRGPSHRFAGRLVAGVGRSGGSAALLGVLVAVQITLGEEPLLIFALAFGVFAVVYYLHRPRTGLRVVRGLAPTVGIAAVITLALTAFPLWWQFRGPQSYSSIDHGPMGNDLEALVQFPSESLGGMLAPGQNVAINPTEQNAYFGWPLLILVAVAAAVLWRRRDRSGRERAGYLAVRACTTVTVVFGVLSLGGTARLSAQPTGITLPWHWLAHKPMLDTVLETRFTMAAIPAIAAILTVATDRALHYWTESLSDPRPMIWCAALGLALIPLAPTSLPVTQRPATPAFFTDGAVQRYVHGGSVVIAPPPTRLDAHPLRWQYDADFDFPIAGGYFVGPMVDKKGGYGPIDRPTAGLLMQVEQSGRIPAVGAAQRAQARTDLRYWRADVVVLPPTVNGDALHDTLDQLLGAPGQYVDGVWVWDVHGLR